MGVIRGLGLSLFSVLLVISLSLAITLYSANTILYPEVYKNSLEKNNVYNQFGSEFENQSRQAIDSSLESFLSYVRGDSDSVGNSEFFQASGINSSKMEQFRSYVKIYKWAFYSSIILSIVFLILIFLISRNFLSSSKIFGLDLFIAGISTIVSVIVAKPILEKNIFANAQPDFELMKNLVSDISSSVFAKMNFYGYSAIGLGAVVFVLFWILKKKQGE